ncbi:hypothetical protein J8273_8315 [Carpediemonas membranifera]|uniref:Uncharacterized protein n=1 Tax=Carpediemonas membranifera TaxID=201153 RepID=A0A8J6ARE1_9EUKA|nr:hypothetical protein J8273_8315 [Carpediemonas membranifera]|eukprot:KAG9390275.1 hypothetical protein J8273_8315 [Carpediemonas membranifera]
MASTTNVAPVTSDAIDRHRFPMMDKLRELYSLEERLDSQIELQRFRLLHVSDISTETTVKADHILRIAMMTERTSGNQGTSLAINLAVFLTDSEGMAAHPSPACIGDVLGRLVFAIEGLSDHPEALEINLATITETAVRITKPLPDNCPELKVTAYASPVESEPMFEAVPQFQEALRLTGPDVVVTHSKVLPSGEREVIDVEKRRPTFTRGKLTQTTVVVLREGGSWVDHRDGLFIRPSRAMQSCFGDVVRFKDIPRIIGSMIRPVEPIRLSTVAGDEMQAVVAETVHSRNPGQSAGVWSPEDIQKIADLDVRTKHQVKATADALAARDRYASLASDPATGLKKMVTDDSVDSRLWRGSDAETADILVSSGFWTDPRLADVMREVLVKSGAHPNVV